MGFISDFFSGPEPVQRIVKGTIKEISYYPSSGSRYIKLEGGGTYRDWDGEMTRNLDVGQKTILETERLGRAYNERIVGVRKYV